MRGKKREKQKETENEGSVRRDIDFEFFESKQKRRRSKSKRTISGALRETAVGGREGSQSAGRYLGCLACYEPG